MPIKDFKETAYWQLNNRLIVANNLNYGIYRILEQERRADNAVARGEIKVSDYTYEWFKRKRKAFVEHRNTVLEKNYLALKALVDSFEKAYKEKEQVLKEELERRFPNKKFDEIIFDGEIIDEEVAEQYYKEATTTAIVLENGVMRAPQSSLIDKYYQYTESRGTYNIAKSIECVHDSIVSDLDSNGYKNLLTQKNETDDVKIIDESFVYELFQLAKSIPAGYKSELLKEQMQLNKLSKMLKRDPENAELQAMIGAHEYTVEFCKDVIERSDYLVLMTKILKERMLSVNKQPYGIADKVIESLADFVYMIPSISKGANSMPKYNTMYMGTYEIMNLINCVKEFPEAAVFTQYLSSKIELATIIPLEDFEKSKVMMAFLKEIHNYNVEAVKNNAELDGIKLSDAEVKAKATKQHEARFLQFETPVGRVWFDGENCINLKTGKTVLLDEINKFALNPNDGQFYYLKTDKKVEPGSVTFVDDSKSAPNAPEGMGKK